MQQFEKIRQKSVKGVKGIVDFVDMHIKNDYHTDAELRKIKALNECLKKCITEMEGIK